jgi:hypothetical protein
MGWNSFDCYGSAANEQVMLENLQVMADRLKPVGYQYFVLDIGWYGEYEIDSGRKFPKAKHADDVRMDEYGRYLPSQTFFPNGLKHIIQRTHECGLKFGIHIMRGIPRKAVELNLPILGTNYRAADIANTRDTCSWCHYNYGINMGKPGSQEYYNSYIHLLAEWGVDFIKADDITGFPQEIAAVVKGIEQCGRDIVLSLSPGGQTKMERMEAYKLANMVRITKDVWDNRRDLQNALDAWFTYQEVRKEGFWLDMDMIPFGHLTVWRPQESGEHTGGREELLTGKGYERMCGLTTNQKYTFITMRALAASPLFMGGDLPTSDEFSFELITNSEMISCNQNGVSGRNIYRHEGIEIWEVPKRGTDGEGWIGIFNRNEQSTTVNFSIEQLSLDDSSQYQFENIWNVPTMQVDGTRIRSEIGGDGVLFMKYIGAKN